MNQPIVHPDIQRVVQVTKTNVELIVTMHETLQAITTCQTGLTMRYLADKCLTRVEEIAQTLEVQNA